VIDQEVWEPKKSKNDVKSTTNWEGEKIRAECASGTAITSKRENGLHNLSSVNDKARLETGRKRKWRVHGSRKRKEFVMVETLNGEKLKRDGEKAKQSLGQWCLFSCVIGGLNAVQNIWERLQNIDWRSAFDRTEPICSDESGERVHGLNSDSFQERLRTMSNNS
jgi:hypothetical protein